METLISQPTKVLYTAKTHTTGNRENGVSRSDDGNLDIRIALPGSGKPGTNPEQLFAAGWSACFDGALGIAAGKSKVTLPADRWIDAEVDLNLNGASFFLRARLNIHLPGLDPEVARSLTDAASTICPYSKAIEGNVDVEYNLI
ncbi:MAG TPA: organic hydroperoxide resistance protein [Puia sp.]|uniref:organic hydroperoxide resistance protein n=1 Tax=Puia sp. TaxID=2045100 RepID=UPI002C112D7D|nr:organic hydroperoxide resistance protein [Puia sp.]HVU96528.1 organic hydroperoxide resistance protein [Puia sp.]